MGYVFLDTETTGLDPTAGDELLEIALVSECGAILFNGRVRPERKREWPDAQAVHGISPDDVAGALPASAVIPVIQHLAAGHTVVGHCIDFDLGFFPAGTFDNTLCTRELAKRFEQVRGFPFASRRLDYLSDAAGHVWNGRAHSALADALACRAVFNWLQQQFAEFERLLEAA